MRRCAGFGGVGGRSVMREALNGNAVLVVADAREVRMVILVSWIKETDARVVVELGAEAVLGGRVEHDDVGGLVDDLPGTGSLACDGGRCGGNGGGAWSGAPWVIG